MIKRFYSSLVSLKYVYFMFGLPMMIFILAFIETTRKSDILRILMIICAAILAFVMVLYYRDKHKIRKILKAVDSLEEYERGGMIDRSYILEDRMLICDGLNLQEKKTVGVTKLTLNSEKHGKYFMTAVDHDGSWNITALSEKEAEHFAAFLKRKNPDMELVDIKAEGKGDLRALGAGVSVK